MMHPIPDVTTLQKELLDTLLAAGAQRDVKVVLDRYRDSPRIGLNVSTYQQALDLLEACPAQLIVSDPETSNKITSKMLRQTQRSYLRIWKPILVNGRMIHGQPSGIDLTIRPETESALSIDFPHPAFGNLWLNTHLSKRTVWVDPALLQRRARSKQPEQTDIVFTWVNDQDLAWRKKRRKFDATSPTKDATDIARFASNDELLYALRGLFRYFDGLGRVYLVTDSQKPDFWEEFSDMVTIIDHDLIMSSDVARPTFNSHVIESCLHKIPNLADQYIYLNDDVIIANPTGVFDFFDDEGRAKVFYSQKNKIPETYCTSGMLAADVAAINARKILVEHYQYRISRKFQHCPIAINKSVIIEIENKFLPIFEHLRQMRFRSKTDIAPSGSLYQHYALLTNKAIGAEIFYRYLDMMNPKLPTEMLRLSVVPAYKRPTIVCLNAVTGGPGSILNRISVRWQLNRLFPVMTKPVQHKSLRQKLHRFLLEILLDGFRLFQRLKI